MKKYLLILSSLLLTAVLTACSPEVGTQAWCEAVGEKAKGDWTANEAKDFAKYCLLKNYKDG